MGSDDILLLQFLANGVDVRTGRSVGPEHLLRDPDVADVLRIALTELVPDDQKRYRRRGRRATNAPAIPNRIGERWDAGEIERLRSAFFRAVDFGTIALTHGRTRGAIVSQLHHMGLIPGKSLSRR